MITQIPTTEQQTAILAVCPRPRALARAAAGSIFATRVPVGMGAAWPCTAAGIAASLRRPDSAVAERPTSGYGAGRVLRDAVRLEVGSGNGNAGTAMSAHGTEQQDPQHKQHLTTRRGPVTWRPPH